MNGSRGLLTTTLMAAALLFAGEAARAMTFPQFDHMANQDRQDFLDSFSVAAETVLKQQGRADDAAKVHHLFNDISPGSDLPLGEAELEVNLADARVRDAEKQIKDSNAPRVQVESALALTLKVNGVEITPAFVKGLLQITSTFKPKLPPL